MRESIDDATPADWDNINFESEGAEIKHYKKIMTEKTDYVNSPPHYNSGDIECIDAIQAMLTPDEFIGYLRGNSLKYRWRFRYNKKPIEDLRKANWYEDKLLNFYTDNSNELGQEG